MTAQSEHGADLDSQHQDHRTHQEELEAEQPAVAHPETQRDEKNALEVASSRLREMV